MATAKLVPASACPKHATDEGFTLIEVVVALMLIVTVMTATASFFIGGLGATRLMQQRQSAIAVATEVMEEARSRPHTELPPGSVITGTPRQVGNIDYMVQISVSECGMPVDGSGCVASTAPPNTLMYRVAVNVRWTPRSGMKCGNASGLCEYTLTTLRDPALSQAAALHESVQP